MDYTNIVRENAFFLSRQRTAGCPGYDRDDGYIMVEDELQTVAQSYTAHLHHAEYKRLVKQARQAPPKALPAPTSPMSEEAKNRLKTAALERRQRNTLRRVTADKTREGEEEGEDEKVANLWSGTSLAPLMVGGNEQKRSLVGLEGISSSTKAGLGLTRIQSSRKETRGGNEGDALELNDVHGKAPQQRDAVVNAITSQTIPVTRVVDKNSSESRPAPAVGEPATRPLTKRKFFFDLDDGWDTPETVIKSEDDRRKSRPALLSDKGKEKKSRLDEVPMWL
ncbi:hypothetical protein A1O7_08222 [Cladophialophora yegresii CBS 114405]|uniref:Uncharacterized protein n=1 Tax=Cladophialophora yegresii CBS 114405 TaxID=1182544 RepID=W9VQJ7_9EURO|nr:uncharacterized protein A1O7_08222 [Cladophialophora yegresii CBS 114405]EXJ55295.1 hypothetical protein A1O7_08222 [Cladophialophora yegresii CBS 114405]